MYDSFFPQRKLIIKQNILLWFTLVTFDTTILVFFSDMEKLHKG